MKKNPGRLPHWGGPQWRELWQNLFISNTPYTIFDND